MKNERALPLLSAAASLVGIFAGESARSLTSWMYVEVNKKMNTTLTRRKRKYLSKRNSKSVLNSIQLGKLTCASMSTRSSYGPGILEGRQSLLG